MLTIRISKTWATHFKVRLTFAKSLWVEWGVGTQISQGSSRKWEMSTSRLLNKRRPLQVIYSIITLPRYYGWCPKLLEPQLWGLEVVQIVEEFHEARPFSITRTPVLRCIDCPSVVRIIEFQSWEERWNTLWCVSIATALWNLSRLWGYRGYFMESALWLSGSHLNFLSLSFFSCKMEIMLACSAVMTMGI